MKLYLGGKMLGVVGYGFAEFDKYADYARIECQTAFAQGCGTHRHIVAEEFWEAMAETDWSLLRPELIQTMATIHKWIKDGDARGN